jgi:hypothetical protein
MRGLHRSAGFWIVTLLTIGTALAVGLLVQTVVNYRYVSDNLIQEEARRAADRTTRALDRSLRLSRPEDLTAFVEQLDSLRAERAEQVASLAVRQNGAVVAASGPAIPVDAAALAATRFQPGRPARLVETTIDGRAVLAGEFPCACRVPGDLAADTPGPPAAGQTGPGRGGGPFGRSSVAVALYRDSLSAPFARLRRDALISAAAALTLLGALALIAVRFGPYVRGKQLEAQVDVARQVQRDLLPSPDALPAGLDLGAECLPASRVGGDFYDVVPLGGDRLAFVVGDVSGHGIAAALLMGLIHGAMSGPPWGASDDEAERAARLNDLLFTKSSSERYATLFWCAFDPAAGTLRYINAGHPPPARLRRDEGGRVAVDRLTEGGPVIGLLAHAEYRTESIAARAGDVLILFSDGLTEATDARGDFYGEERLIDVAVANAGRPAREISNAILAAVRAFSGDRPIEDDQTLLVVRLSGATGSTSATGSTGSTSHNHEAQPSATPRTDFAQGRTDG